MKKLLELFIKYLPASQLRNKLIFKRNYLEINLSHAYYPTMQRATDNTYKHVFHIFKNKKSYVSFCGEEIHAVLDKKLYDTDEFDICSDCYSIYLRNKYRIVDEVSYPKEST